MARHYALLGAARDAAHARLARVLGGSPARLAGRDELAGLIERGVYRGFVQEGRHAAGAGAVAQYDAQVRGTFIKLMRYEPKDAPAAADPPGDVSEAAEAGGPGTLVAERVLAGRLESLEVPGSSPSGGHREVMRWHLAEALTAHPHYTDRFAALRAVQIIERSCYNHIVRRSKNSAELAQRHWLSDDFLDAYGTRCGTICRLLMSPVYGPTLVAQLASGQLDPYGMGDKSERDLCPQAAAAAREAVQLRSSQKVEEKESIMFSCPHCGVRRCTYTEVQSRALDEAPNYECFCLACRRRFSGYS